MAQGRFIALALEAPDPRYWKASAFRETVSGYEHDKDHPHKYRYTGRRPIGGYFTLIRWYPDSIDWHLMEAPPRRLIEAANDHL